MEIILSLQRKLWNFYMDLYLETCQAIKTYIRSVPTVKIAFNYITFHVVKFLWFALFDKYMHIKYII